MLPRGNTYARGKAIVQKRDAYGNAVVRMNENPILDMRKYGVEFYDGEVRKLTENMFAESIYAACDDSGNEYLIMELIVDNRNNEKYITVSDQKVVHISRGFMWKYTVV